MVITAVCLSAAGAGKQVFSPPTLKEVRSAMGIPSTSDERGQKDAVGYASTAAQMAEVWRLSVGNPPPIELGTVPKKGIVGVVCPHDDYVYAGRVYRRILPAITAKRVVVLGVFHGWRRFGARDRLIFDDYAKWRSPDGPVEVSALREELLKGLPAGEAFVSDAAHDQEHSVEAIVFWLKHMNPEVEIVPILVPTMGFDRMKKLAGNLAIVMNKAAKAHGWKIGKDVQVVVSSDAVHYGPDFDYTPFGKGGVEAYEKAFAQDLSLINGPMSGVVTDAKVRELFSRLCDPSDPARYRITWCGRFSVPFGLLFMRRLAPVRGVPVAYATSVGWPELKVKGKLPGKTAPDSLYHFVGYPAVAFELR